MSLWKGTGVTLIIISVFDSCHQDLDADDDDGDEDEDHSEAIGDVDEDDDDSEAAPRPKKAPVCCQLLLNSSTQY